MSRRPWTGCGGLIQDQHRRVDFNVTESDGERDERAFAWVEAAAQASRVDIDAKLAQSAKRFLRELLPADEAADRGKAEIDRNSLATVRSAISGASWWTTRMPRLLVVMGFNASAVRTTPPTLTRHPELTGLTPLRALTVVDLPDPFAPKSATILPGGTSRSRLSSARCVPKRTERLRTESLGSTITISRPRAPGSASLHRFWRSTGPWGRQRSPW